MKIGINGQKLLIREPAGPEVYTYNIVNALSKIDSENEYTIFFDREPPEDYFDKLISGNSKFTYKVISRFLSWTQLQLAFELLFNPVDIFFTPVHTMPIIRSRKLKVVGMIHGLEYKSNTKKTELDFVRAAPIKYVAENANYLIVPSSYTKKALLESSWRVDSNCIEIISEGVSKKFYDIDTARLKEVLGKHKLDHKEYLVSVSTVQPRKNYPRLIEAFSRLEDIKGLKLIICGKKGWEFEESLEAPKKYGVEDNVVYLGRVSDESLPYLLHGAKLFLSASLEEGFGLPLLEAMACETYCVVSDITPYRDIGLGEVTYFDPLDVKDISKKISKALEWVNSGNAEESIKKAKEISRSFSWENAALRTIEVFKKVLTA